MKRGFTLVELLVTAALLTLVAGSCAATFAGGFLVWRRLEERGSQRAWVSVAFDQLRRDLHGVRRFKPISFEGAYDRFSFPAVIPVMSEDGVEAEEIGQRGYYVDRWRRTLCRSQQPYRRLRHARLTDACSPMLSGVDGIRMSYYGRDSDRGTAGWTSSWSSPEPPLAVKVEVTAQDGAAPRRGEAQALLVHLPAASMPAPES